MKYVIFSLLIITHPLSAFFSSEETLFYLKNATPEEAHLLLNITYWSYKRSHSTLITQETACKALEEVWETWLSCAQRRLDPQATHAYALPSSHFTSTKLFEDYSHEHAVIRERYAHIIEQFTTTAHLSISMENYITHMRAESRAVVSNVLWHNLKHCKETVEPFYNSLVQAVHLFKRTIIEDIPEDEEITKNFITNHILNILEGLEVQSFIKLDTEYMRASDVFFDTFLASQKVLNNIWHDIEIARLTFYRARYHEIYQALTTLRFPEKTFKNFFAPEQLPAVVE